MGRKRRVFTDKFKAKVAMEAVKGVKTLAELELLSPTFSYSHNKLRLPKDNFDFSKKKSRILF